MRRLLQLAAAAVFAAAEQPVWVQNQAYLKGDYGPYPMQSYHSVNYYVPRVNFATWSEENCVDEDRYYFLAVHGGIPVPGAWPFILDTRGNLVWTFQPFAIGMSTLSVQQWRGKDVLTYYQGKEIVAHGAGVYHIMDDSYNVIKVVKGKNGLDADNHELTITKEGTAIFTTYTLIPSPWNLTDIGFQPVPKYNATLFGTMMEQRIWDSGFQEVSLEDDSLVFEWRAADHFSQDQMLVLAWSEFDYEMTEGHDWFHINSVVKDAFGNYLISSRYNSALSYISGKTGDVIWNLGGKLNDFKDLGGATEYWCQHMARFLMEPTVDLTQPNLSKKGKAQVSLFDNGEFWGAKKRPSRGLFIELDFDKMTARLLSAFNHPEGVWAESQGSIMAVPAMSSARGYAPINSTTPNIAVLGYGYAPAIATFSSEGALLCDMRFASLAQSKSEPSGFTQNKWAQSYRTTFQAWIGNPKTLPDTAIVGGKLWVSWNGATAVRSWKLEGGGWNTAQTKMGFETGLDLPGPNVTADVFVLTALGKTGNIVGSWGMDKGGRLSVLDANAPAPEFMEEDQAASAPASAQPVSPPPPPPANDSLLNDAASLVLVLLAVLVVAGVFLYRRLRRGPKDPTEEAHLQEGGAYSKLEEEHA